MPGYDYFTRRIPWVLILRDRDDGTLWALNTTTTPNAHPISLLQVSGTDFFKSNVLYTIGRDIVVSQNPSIRLIVRNGYLGYEHFKGASVAAPPPFEPVSSKTGQKTNPSWLVQMPDGWAAFDPLSALELTP